VNKPVYDDLNFEPFKSEYESSFPDAPIPLYESSNIFTDKFIPFSDIPAQFSENLYLGNMNNRSALGDTFNKVKLSSTYWFNSLFNNSTEINRGYVPVPLHLFEDLDKDFDDKLEGEKINEILNQIELNNDSIIKSLAAYKIPAPVYKLIIKKIIYLSLQYSSNE
jgi:hypothetical protein